MAKGFGSAVGVGISEKPFRKNVKLEEYFPGMPPSFGWSGQIHSWTYRSIIGWLSGSHTGKVEEMEGYVAFSTGDIIGCGFLGKEKTVFYTLNGEKFDEWRFPLRCSLYCPEPSIDIVTGTAFVEVSGRLNPVVGIESQLRPGLQEQSLPMGAGKQQRLGHDDCRPIRQGRLKNYSDCEERFPASAHKFHLSILHPSPS
jgi:hypothetical protein